MVINSFEPAVSSQPERRNFLPFRDQSSRGASPVPASPCASKSRISPPLSNTGGLSSEGARERNGVNDDVILDNLSSILGVELEALTAPSNIASRRDQNCSKTVTAENLNDPNPTRRERPKSSNYSEESDSGGRSSREGSRHQSNVLPDVILPGSPSSSYGRPRTAPLPDLGTGNSPEKGRLRVVNRQRSALPDLGSEKPSRLSRKHDKRHLRKSRFVDGTKRSAKKSAEELKAEGEDADALQEVYDAWREELGLTSSFRPEKSSILDAPATTPSRDKTSPPKTSPAHVKRGKKTLRAAAMQYCKIHERKKDKRDSNRVGKGSKGSRPYAFGDLGAITEQEERMSLRRRASDWVSSSNLDKYKESRDSASKSAEPRSSAGKSASRFVLAKRKSSIKKGLQRTRYPV